MTIDNYIYFNNNFTNETLSNAIKRINNIENCELILTSGPILNDVIDDSNIKLNFDFKFKNNDYGKVLIDIQYINEENIISEIIDEQDIEIISNIENVINDEKFTKEIVISVVPKDDASAILFQILTKEITEMVEGLAMCYLLLQEDEEIKFFSYKDIKAISDSIINGEYDEIYINNKNCIEHLKSSWEKVNRVKIQDEDKSHAITEFKVNFKYSFLYLIISIILFLSSIFFCPTDYLTDASVIYQKFANLTFILLMLNVPIFILPFIISMIKMKVENNKNYIGG